MSTARHIVLTGLPGVGKTTLIKKICEQFNTENISNISGFYTEDVRDNSNSRIGFDIVALNGERRRLSRTTDHIKPGDNNKYTVGRYVVFPNEFENFAVPLLENVGKSKQCAFNSFNSIFFKKDTNVVVIDEVGKMELLSDKFKEMVIKIFNDPQKIIIATVPVAKGKPIPIIENIRSSPNTHLVTVHRNNRNELLEEILEYIFVINKQLKK